MKIYHTSSEAVILELRNTEDDSKCFARKVESYSL